MCRALQVRANEGRALEGVGIVPDMYTAFRQIDLTMDTGADFSAEFKAATEMQSKQGGWAVRPRGSPFVQSPARTRT